MKKRNTQFLHFSIILVLIMVNSCTQTPPSVIIKEPQSLPVSVTGRVVDIDSNSPIEGAEILLQDVQDIPMFSDKDGYFQSGSNTKPYSGKNEIIIKITKDNYTYKGEEGGKIIKIDLGENDLRTFRLTVITPPHRPRGRTRRALRAGPRGHRRRRWGTPLSLGLEFYQQKLLIK